MCYDVSATHRNKVRENNVRMKQIENQKPKDFFNDPEWKELSQDNSWRNHIIKDYDRKIRMGIKF